MVYLLKMGGSFHGELLNHQMVDCFNCFSIPCSTHTRLSDYPTIRSFSRGVEQRCFTVLFAFFFGQQPFLRSTPQRRDKTRHKGGGADESMMYHSSGLQLTTPFRKKTSLDCLPCLPTRCGPSSSNLACCWTTSPNWRVSKGYP